MLAEEEPAQGEAEQDEGWSRCSGKANQGCKKAKATKVEPEED